MADDIDGKLDALLRATDQQRACEIAQKIGKLTVAEQCTHGEAVIALAMSFAALADDSPSPAKALALVTRAAERSLAILAARRWR